MIVPENAHKAVALWQALGLGRNPRRSGLLEHRPLKPVDLAKVPPAIGVEIHRTSRRARRQQERLRKDGMRREQLMRWCRREGLGSRFGEHGPSLARQLFTANTTPLDARTANGDSSQVGQLEHQILRTFGPASSMRSGKHSLLKSAKRSRRSLFDSLIRVFIKRGRLLK